MPDSPDAVVSSSALSGSAVAVITTDRQAKGTQNVQLCTLTANRVQTVKATHKADIACRRLAGLSLSVTRHHLRVWQR
jgi:hypothetical protein